MMKNAILTQNNIETAPFRSLPTLKSETTQQRQAKRKYLHLSNMTRLKRTIPWALVLPGFQDTGSGDMHGVWKVSCSEETISGARPSTPSTNQIIARLVRLVAPSSLPITQERKRKTKCPIPYLAQCAPPPWNAGIALEMDWGSTVRPSSALVENTQLDSDARNGFDERVCPLCKISKAW